MVYICVTLCICRQCRFLGNFLRCEASQSLAFMAKWCPKREMVLNALSHCPLSPVHLPLRIFLCRDSCSHYRAGPLALSCPYPFSKHYSQEFTSPLSRPAKESCCAQMLPLGGSTSLKWRQSYSASFSPIFTLIPSTLCSDGPHDCVSCLMKKTRCGSDSMLHKTRACLCTALVEPLAWVDKATRCYCSLPTRMPTLVCPYDCHPITKRLFEDSVCAADLTARVMYGCRILEH